MLRLVRGLGCEPSVLGGHSFGELVALHAAGVVDTSGLAELASERGRLMKEASGSGNGAMAALRAGASDVEAIIRNVPGLQAANWNGPSQTVIAGPCAAVSQAIELAARRGIAGSATARLECVSHTDGGECAPSRSSALLDACCAAIAIGRSTLTWTRLPTLLFPQRSPHGWRSILPGRFDSAK